MPSASPAVTDLARSGRSATGTTVRDGQRTQAATSGATGASVSPAVTSTWAGSGSSGLTDGVGAQASFQQPLGMHVVGGVGYLFDSNLLRKVDLASGAVSTVAGIANTDGCTDSTDPAQATFGSGGPMADDGTFLYFLDSSHCGYSMALRRMSLSTQAISTVIRLDSWTKWSGLTVGPNGLLYAAVDNKIERIDTVNGTRTTVATVAAADTTSTVGYSAKLGAMTADGTALYVTSVDTAPYTAQGTSRILKIDPTTGSNTTITTAPLRGSFYGGLSRAGSFLYTGVSMQTEGGTTATSVVGYSTGNSPSQQVTTGLPGLNALDASGSDFIAVDNLSRQVLRLSAAPQGPVLQDETAGGSNPSEACSSRCHADPVNAITGEFFLSTTDLSVAGVGPGLTFNRFYGSSVADTNDRLGFGWRSNYATRLEIAPGATGSALADASTIWVRQENSSVVSFNRAGDGTLTPAARVLASLTRQADGTFTLLRRPDQVFTFSAAGVLQKVADLNGNTTSLTYTSAGLLDRATGLNGTYLQFGYDTNGRLAQVADHTGRKVLYGYNSAGELTSVTDVTGRVTAFGYAAGHLLNSATDARGAVTTNTYDTSARVTSQRDPIGRVTTWAYTTSTAGGRTTGTTTIADPAGGIIVERHTDGQVTSETVASGTPAEATTSYTYDATNHVTSSTDPLGSKTTATYDSLGNRTSATDPLGRVTTWAYSQPGDRVTKIVDPTGAVTSHTYDSRGNLTATVDPTGRKATQTINPNGTVATSVDPRGNVTGGTVATYTTTYGYNAAGNRTSTTGPDGAKTTITYNALQRPIKLTDPRGTVTGT